MRTDLRHAPTYYARTASHEAIIGVIERELAKFDEVDRLILIDGLVAELAKRRP